MGHADDGGGIGEQPTALPDASRPRTGRRHPLVAAAASVLFPGLGHLLAGQRRRGAWIVGTCVVAIVAALLFVRRQRSTEVLAWGVQPRWLWVAIITSIVVLVIRLVVGADAYLRQRTARGIPPVLHLLTLALLAALALAPHLLVIRYSAVQLDTLDEVFVATYTEVARPTPLAGSDSDPEPTTTTIPPTTTTEAASPPASVPLPAETTTTTIPPTTTTVPTWDGDERLTIVLLGGDGGFDRRSCRDPDRRAQGCVDTKQKTQLSGTSDRCHSGALFER